MFEKVLAGERRRRHQRNRQAMAASVLAHALLTIGATRVPLGPEIRAATVEEVVSFVDLALPARPRTAERMERPASPAPGRAASGQGAARRDDVLASLPTAEAPTAVPDRVPEVSVEMALPLSLASAAAIRMPLLAGSGAGSAEDAVEAGDVVEADVLAERPRLSNRAEMERVWQELYPRMLEMRGVTGETLVSFVIDENGRVVDGTVVLLSASREEFGNAALRGVPRLRFRPMKVGGVPVRVRTTLPVLFRLAST